ncbi:MAG TPA: class I SAM-dependent methyltransferase [Paracoccaceae bacterium]|nr:class I SAM-dependent methyltransferase [Paracoccaceae bacterium]
MDRDTNDFYQLNARKWAAAFPYEFSAFLDPFCMRLEPGAKVLELGCGDGRDAARMEAKGLVVDPTDGTQSMAELAAERLGRPARQMEFGQLDVIEGYDAVWAHAALHHQPIAGLDDVLGRILRALKPGGWFFANYKLGTGEARDALGRLYNFPPRADLMALYDRPRWSIMEAHDYRDSGMDKVVRNWVAITVQKDAA